LVLQPFVFPLAFRPIALFAQLLFKLSNKLNKSAVVTSFGQDRQRRK